MKQNRTELVFILDRSGSMAGLETDTIGGFNSVLTKQQETPGKAVVTTVLFDDRYELLHDRIDLRAVAPVTGKEYFVRGSTALLDAVGRTVEKIHSAQQRTAPAYRADKVLVVITTDGLENASREYTYARVKELVERQQKEYGWEFLFLGANIDAVETAAQVGITREGTSNFIADSEGTRLHYEAVAAAVCRARAGAPLRPDWKEEVEADYERRSRELAKK